MACLIPSFYFLSLFEKLHRTWDYSILHVFGFACYPHYDHIIQINCNNTLKSVPFWVTVHHIRVFVSLYSHCYISQNVFGESSFPFSELRLPTFCKWVFQLKHKSNGSIVTRHGWLQKAFINYLKYPVVTCLVLLWSQQQFVLHYHSGKLWLLNSSIRYRRYPSP